MTSFLRKVFTFTQPKTASTSKTAARPNPKTTAASSQQVADGLTLFNAFDMDSEDEYLDIKPFTIKRTKTTAAPKKQDKPTMAVPSSHPQTQTTLRLKLRKSPRIKSPVPFPPSAKVPSAPSSRFAAQSLTAVKIGIYQR